MSFASRLFAHAAQQIAGALLSFTLWMLWALLIAIAAVQGYIATTHQLRVPSFVLRNLEGRLAEAGLKANFDRATFDPTGRILVESPRISLPGFGDPVVTARAAYVGLSPWLLAAGRVEIREIRILDGRILVPAMLSPSGKAEPVVRDVDALIIPGDKELMLQHVTGRISGLTVSLHGSLLPAATPSRRGEDVTALVRARFNEFCRVALDVTRRLEAFEQPSLDLELSPSANRGAIVTADFVARRFRLDAPVAAEFGPLHVSTHFPLLGETPSTLQVAVVVDELRLPGQIEVRGLNAVLRGRVRPAQRRIDPVEIELSADSVKNPEVSATALTGVLHPRDASAWDADVVGRVMDSPLEIEARTDWQARTASVRFRGAISPNILQIPSGRTKVDVRKFFDFDALTVHQAKAEFGAGWRFERLTGDVALRGIRAHGIVMEEGRAQVQLDPKRFYSPDAYARIGENFARGTYEHIFATHEFRFLLEGRLRPLDIGEWFHSWWQNFFERLAFPVRPPDASVDVQGVWGDGRRSSVFVFADAAAPTILTQKLARMRTRLFIRPGFYDDLEMYGVDPSGGIASGVFTVTADVDSGQWRTVDVDGRSTFPLPVAAGMAGAFAKPILDPFEVVQSPTVRLVGHFDGPALGEVRHERFELEASAPGSFKLYQLGFEDVAFTASLNDDVLTVNAQQAKFAGGALHGNTRIWGLGPNRRVSFNGVLTDARLGVAVSALQNFAAERKGQPPPAPGKFVQEKANVRLDVTAAGEGAYGNPLSVHGEGNASLRGAEIGEVPLLGALSELLRFTALRFTTAKTAFKINGPKIEFPSFALRGANSAIDAHGEYALDKRQLDFRAKILPFQESESVIKNVVGAVLSPISTVLEVRLTGTLEKPDWAFVIGPTNLFRSLSEETPAVATTPGATPAQSSPTTTPGPGGAKESPKSAEAGADPAKQMPSPVQPAPKLD